MTKGEDLFLRVATLAPAHEGLSAFGPFPSGRPYVHAEHAQASPVQVAESLRVCRQLFAQGVTAGVCTVPAVKALFFDMDATVIAEESLVELAGVIGKGEEVARVTEQAMAGELDFKAALHARVALLAGMDETLCTQVAQGLTLNPGIKELVVECQKRGIKTFMVSGGFVRLCAVIQYKVGFDGMHANVLGARSGKLTGLVEGDIVDAEGKRRYLLATCERYGFQPQEVAAIGDGANDLLMLQTAGVAVGHQAKPILFPHLHALNAVGDHRYLATLLFGESLLPSSV